MTISHQIVRNLRNDSQNPGQSDDKEIDLDDHLRSASKKILQKIEFVESSQSNTFNLHKLKSKYVVLNASSAKMKDTKVISTSKTSSYSSDASDDGVPPPKKVFFPPEKVELSWRKPARAGAGLYNLGNTCFLNSALQCLTYTAPLANYLVHMNHRKNCRVNGQFCMLCAMQQHLTNVQSSAGQTVKPMCILKNLRMIAKHLQFGRQEDAHEFIRYSVDAMQKSCLFGYPNKIDVHTKATTAVHQIFGGYLRSRVRCKHCRSVSDTYDPFLDLSLDISKQGCVDLQKCLEIFVRAEVLQGDNSYKCASCKNTVQAMKKFSVHRPPNVLMIQLKRFSNFFGNKINKEISYPSKLNLAPYMSNKPENGLWYELYAVLVHSGYSCQSGHYYAYAKASNGQWYCFNDASVHQVSVNQALNQQAYLLFYAQCPRTASQIGNLKLKKSLYGKNLLGIPSQKQETKPEVCSKIGIKDPGSTSAGFRGTGSHSHLGPKMIEDRPASSGPVKKISYNNGAANQLSKPVSFRINYKQTNGKTELNMNKSSTLPTKLHRAESSPQKPNLTTSKWSQSAKNVNEAAKSSGVVNSKTPAIRPLVSYSSDESSESETEQSAPPGQSSLYSSISSTLRQIRQSCSSAMQLVKGKNEEQSVGKPLNKPTVESSSSSVHVTGEVDQKDAVEREPILDVLHGEMKMENGDCKNKQKKGAGHKENGSSAQSQKAGTAKDVLPQSPGKFQAKESKKRHFNETEEGTESKKKQQMDCNPATPDQKSGKREMKSFDMFSLENSSSKKRKIEANRQQDAIEGKRDKSQVKNGNLEAKKDRADTYDVKIKQKSFDVNGGKQKNYDSLFCDSQKYAENMKKKAKKRKKQKEMLERKLQSSFDEESSDSSNCNPIGEEGSNGLKRNDSSTNLGRDDKKEGQEKNESSKLDSAVKGEEKSKERVAGASICNRASHMERENPEKEEAAEKGSNSTQGSKSKERPNILAQLLRQSSGKAYGAKIDTWSGDDSLVEKDAEKTWNGQQVALVDDWDKEYDRGKTKKVKKKLREEKCNNGNLFQKFQDLKNQKNL